MNGKDEEWVMIFGRKNRLQSYKNVFTMNKILKKNGWTNLPTRFSGYRLQVSGYCRDARPCVSTSVPCNLYPIS